MRRSGTAFPITDYKGAPATLWDSEISSVDGNDWFDNLISRAFYSPEEGCKYGTCMFKKEATNVFHHKILGLDVADQSRKVVNQQVAFVMSVLSATNREPLAWRASEHNINIACDVAEAPKRVASLFGQVNCVSFGVWKIEIVRIDVELLEIKRTTYLKTCLFKPKRQPTNAAKEVQ